MAKDTAVPNEVSAGQALWVEIRSPDGLIWAGTAKAITVPGVDGSMGVLPRHAALMSSLEVGRTRLRDAKSRGGADSRARFDLVSGDGFVEILDNKVLMLVDFADDTATIDVARARAARERAEARLRTPGEEIDRARAEAALGRAVVRLRYAGA